MVGALYRQLCVSIRGSCFMKKDLLPVGLGRFHMPKRWRPIDFDKKRKKTREDFRNFLHFALVVMAAAKSSFIRLYIIDYIQI